jgi:hypothetical protein
MTQPSIISSFAKKEVRRHRTTIIKLLCNSCKIIISQLFNPLIKQLQLRLSKKKLTIKNRTSTPSILNWNLTIAGENKQFTMTTRDYDKPILNTIYKINLKEICMSLSNILLSLAPPNYDGALNTTFKTERIPFVELETKLKSNNFSSIIWKNGIRSKENFYLAESFVVDQDNGLKIEEAEKILQEEGINYALITSRNHTEENHRFHIILPFNRRTLTLKNYEIIAANIVNNLFPSSDPTVCDGGRFLFHSPEDAIYKSWFDGDNYNVD